MIFIRQYYAKIQQVKVLEKKKRYLRKYAEKVKGFNAGFDQRVVHTSGQSPVGKAFNKNQTLSNTTKSVRLSLG